MSGNTIERDILHKINASIDLDNPFELYTLIKKRLSAHRIRTYKYQTVEQRKAAVLIPLFNNNGTTHLLFTKRTEKVEHHKGQISFPGGMHDAGDKGLQETALRETNEEMGIQPSDITLLGRTDNFLTNTSFMITPYVGFYPFPYNYQINKDEIAKVIEVPLRFLLDPEIFQIKKLKRHGIMWDVHYYYYRDEIIWGVTGFLLSNFLSIVFGLPRMNGKIT